MIIVVLMATMVLSACERDRPVPAAAPTPLGGTPRSSVTPIVLPNLPAGTQIPPAPLGGQGTAPGPAALATSPAPGSAAAPGNRYFFYQSAAGDTLASLAQKFRVTAESIATLNGLSSGSALATGQELKIPGEAPEGYTGYTTYLVQAGDNLAAIAARYGLTVPELQQLNNLTNPNQLMAGSVLRVPATRGTAPSTTARPTAPAAPPAASGSTTNYTVKAGESLAAIAARYGITAAELQRLNGLSDPNLLRVGQTIKVPGQAQAPAPATTGGRKHVVQRGETLYSIAVRYGVTVTALQAANDLSNPDQIRVGQTLQIP